MTVSTQSVNRAPRPSGLADVLDLVLDKGIVIDAYVRLAVVGIEILTLDARVVIASVDTYLRFAEAVNRLDLQPHDQIAGLPGMVTGLQEQGARSITRGAIAGVTDSAKEVMSSIRGDDDEDRGSTDNSGSARSESRPGSSSGSRTARKRTSGTPSPASARKAQPTKRTATRRRSTS